MKKILYILFFIPLFVQGQYKVEPDVKPMFRSVYAPLADLDSLDLFVISAHDRDTAIVTTAIGFATNATNYLLEWWQSLLTGVSGTGTEVYSGADSTEIQGRKIPIEATTDNQPYAFLLSSSRSGATTVFNRDTTLLDSIKIGADTVVYFIDPTDGSDANTGLSIAQAWENLSKINDIVVPASDTMVIVAIDPRDTIDLTSTVSITVSGTGTDANLIVDGRSPEWSQPNDTATIRNTGSQQHTILFEAARYLTFQNLIMDGVDTTNIAFQFAPILTTDFAEYITIQDCEIKRFNWGIFYSCDSVDNNGHIAQNNTIFDIGWHPIAVYKATANTGTGTNNNISVLNNPLSDWHRTSGATGYGVIVRNQSNGVTIDGNTLTNNTTGDAAGIGIEQATQNGTRYSTNLVIKNNILNLNTHPGIRFDQGNAVTAKVYANEITIDSANGLVVTGGDDWTGADIDWFNNTIVNSGNGDGINLSSYSETFLTIQNNLIFSNDGGPCLDAGSIANITHTNNLYYKEGTTHSSNWVEITTPTGNFTNCAQVQGWEATAECTDPLFEAEFTDLRPKEGSPALLNGTDLTATVPTDIIDSTYFTPMTIGAYADSVVVAYSAEAQALFDQLTWTPGSDTLDQFALAIDSLVDLGYWARMHFLHWEGMENSTDAKLNWLNPSAGTYDLVEEGAGSLTHAKYQGTTGDGTNSYTTNWNPSTDGGSLDDFTLGIYLRLDIDESARQIGVNDGSSRAMMNIRDGNTFFSRYMTSSLTISVANTDSRGLLIMTRRSNTDNEAYRNGSSIATSATASTTVPNENVDVLAESGAGQSTNQVLCDFAMDGISDADVVIINRIIERLADFIGAGVQ